MIKAVIFDWLGTLYAKDMGLFPNTLEVLQILQREGIKMSLVSLTSNEEKRNTEITLSGVRPYLDPILVVPQKSAEQYFCCLQFMRSTNRETLIVDDRTVRGIQIGNNHGFPTAWIRTGVYAHEIPNATTGEPTYKIKTVSDIIPVIRESK